MTIAYLPIDIDVQLPNEQQIIDFCYEHKIPELTQTKDNIKHWYKIPVCGRCESADWYDIEKFKHTLYNRFVPNLYPVKYANEIDRVFPEIPYMLEQLPFKELSFVVMLMQREEVECHTDNQQNDYVVDPSEISIDIEPRRYNIQLTRHGLPSFYVSKDKDSERFYPSITREQPCFALCEQYHWHGADYVTSDKVMLAVFGILDRTKHQQMLADNLAKYKDKAIIF